MNENDQKNHDSSKKNDEKVQTLKEDKSLEEKLKETWRKTKGKQTERKHKATLIQN